MNKILFELQNYFREDNKGQVNTKGKYKQYIVLKRFTDIKSIANLDIMKCYKNVFDKKNIRNNYGFFIIFFIELLYFICLFNFILVAFKQLKYDIKNIVFMLKIKKNKKPNPMNLKQNLIKLDVLNTKQDINNKSDKSNTMILDIGSEINNSEKILEYKEFELNALDYEDALKHDKRTFIQYYFSLLRINHLLMFSFITKNDYNQRVIKSFIFSFFLL